MNARRKQPGRPSKLDEAKRREICAILAVGGSWATAAQYVGCALTTIRRTAGRDPQFAADLKKASSQCEVAHLHHIQTAAREHKQWRASAWALERLHPDRYGRRKPRTAPIEHVALMVGELSEYVLQELPTSDERDRVLRKLDQLTRQLRDKIRSDPAPSEQDQEESSP